MKVNYDRGHSDVSSVIKNIQLALIENALQSQRIQQNVCVLESANIPMAFSDVRDAVESIRIKVSLWRGTHIHCIWIWPEKFLLRNSLV